MSRSLEEDLSATVQKLDMSLKRYYVVHSIQSGHVERALEFFKVCAPELATDKHWKAWFVLPYLKSAESDPNFSIFFSKGWVETFTLSLHNFLATIFQSVPLPKILNFNVDRKLRAQLEKVNDSLMRDNDSLRGRNDKLRLEVDKLNKALTNLNAKIALLEQQLDLAIPTAAQIALLQSQQQLLQQPQQLQHLLQKSSPAGKNDIAPGEVSLVGSVAGAPVPASTTFRRTMPPSTFSNTVGGHSMPSGSSSPSANPATYGASSPFSSVGSSSGPFAPTLPQPTSPIGVDNPPPNSPTGSAIAEASTSHPALLQASKVESFSTNSALNCCKYSPDGNFIACGTQTGVTRIWPVGPNIAHRSATIYGATEILSLAWDQDSKVLLVGSADGKVKVWNVALEKTVGDVVLAPYSRVRDIVCSPSGSMFACAASGLTKDPKSSAIHLLNAKTLQLVAKIDFPGCIVNSFAFNHNESMIVAGGSDGHVMIIGMDNKEPVSSWKAHVGAVLSVSYSPDYASIFTIGADAKMQRWDAHNSGKLLKQYIYSGPVDGAKRVDIAFSEDSASKGYFIVPSKSETAPIYDRETITPILAVGTHKASVTCCDWHPQTLQVMTGCLGGVVCLTSFIVVENKI